jgi:hypothetical protein
MIRGNLWIRTFVVSALALGLMSVTAHAQLFSSPKNVSNDPRFTYTPQVAVDGTGDINVVWEDDTANNSNILFSRSSDGGATFSAPKNISNSSGFSFNPRMAVDSKGKIDVVWVDDTLGNPNVMFSHSSDGGATFSAPVNLSNDTAYFSSPQVAVDSLGNVHVVWESDSGNSGIFYSHSTDGVAFSAPLTLSTNTGGSIAPQLALDLAGNVNVVWEDDVLGFSDISFSRSADKGMTFSIPRSLSNNVGNSISAQLVVDAAGNISALWLNDSPGHYAVFFSRSADHGVTFSVPRNLSNSPGHSNNPQLALGAGQNLYIVWDETVAPSAAPHICFMRSSDAGLTFSAPLNLSGNTGTSNNAQVSMDAAGYINVGWQNNTSGTDDILFARSVDGGTTFAAVQNLSANPGMSTDVQLAADRGGNLNVVWSDRTPGPAQVFFSRLSTTMRVNHPPLANAGASQTLECAGRSGTLVSLNGSASSDPDGDVLSYAWTDELNNPLGTTAIAQVNVACGTHTFTLTVTDPGKLSSSATTSVSIQDTTPPALSISLSPNVLSSRHHRLVQVNAAVQVNDTCDAKPSIELVSITSNDQDNRGKSSDIQAVGSGPVHFGTDVRSFLLRAEQPEHRTPLVYTVTYRARDAAWNTTLATAQVRVAKLHAESDSDSDKHENQ